MKKNVGGKYKTMRIVLGIIFLILGYMVNPWFYVLAAIGFVTAFINYCPLNHMLGINTCKVKGKAQETYVCEGTCGGVAHEPKNCGDSTCTHFDKPLIKKEQ